MTHIVRLAASTVTGRPPAQVAVAAQQIRVDKAVVAQQALIDDWQARLAAGPGAWKAARRAAARSIRTTTTPCAAPAKKASPMTKQTGTRFTE